MAGGPQHPQAALSLWHAEDYIMRHRYLYYVANQPILSDTEYDLVEKQLLAWYPDSHILNSIGSDSLDDYPGYVIDGRRPFTEERERHRKSLAWKLKQVVHK